MQSLSAASAVAAVLLVGALTLVVAEAEQTVEKPVFFRDVPGPSRAQVRAEAEQAAASGPGLRIYNGGVASRTQFPYQAALFIDLNVFCGGSLIHPKWVLTAAHCVAGGNIWYVMLGLTESLSPKQDGRKTFVTRGGVRHPMYDSKKIINDIGVVQLMREADVYGEYIQTIPLTPAGATYIGSMGTVSGFGRTDDTNASPISPVLKYASLPVVVNQVCADRYGSGTGLHPSVICLKAEGSSTCKGDSGGPFTVADARGRPIQVGLVSFGASRGCTLGWPVGYTNIAHLMDWLSDTTGIDFSSSSSSSA